MKTKYIYQILFILMFAMMLAPVEMKAQSTKYIVIANPSVEVETMTASELKSNLKGTKTRWGNKSKIYLGLPESDTDVGAILAQDILGLSPSQMNKYYLTMVFQGKMSSPKFFASEQDLIDYVAKTEGAIGVVSKPVSSGVKTIAIKG